MRRPPPDLCGRSILIVRTDRLGDVILSLPVFAELRERFPGARLFLLASPALAPLAVSHPWIDGLLVDDRRGRHQGMRGFRSLVAEIESERFAAALVLRPTLRNALLVAAARIPRRIGTAFRAYSWLFTDRVHLHRRGSGRHEVELNLALLEPLGGPGKPRDPWVPVDPEARREARALTGEHPYVVLHPGSGGSATEWPPEHFAALGRALVEAHDLRVVLTGIAAESDLVRDVASQVPRALPLAGRTSLPVLAALLAEARAVVAASTGALHLAAAVGAKVIGIYPASPDVSPERWGPRGMAAEVLEPPSALPSGRAHDGDGLKAITPESVLAKLGPWLSSV